MRLYRVSVHTEAFRWYHFATRREADAFVREQRDDLEGETFTIETDVFDVKPTRAGIAEALDDFVSLTCTNEF